MTLSVKAKERLPQLAQFLREKVPDKSFDYRRWYQQGTKTPLEAIEAGGGCGTVGCAMGWTPALWPKEVMWPPIRVGATAFLLIDGIGEGCDPTYLATRLFDISTRQAYEIFHPDQNHTNQCVIPNEKAGPKRVADYIDYYVEHDGNKPVCNCDYESDDSDDDDDD